MLIRHICGLYGSGKKTLIRKILAEPDDGPLRTRFGLAGRCKAYVDDRTRLGRQAAGQPKPEFLPLSAVGKLQANCLLHLWQRSAPHWTGFLRERFPAAEHRILLLWCPFETLVEVRKARAAFNPSLRILTAGEFADNWAKLLPQLQQEGLPIEIVASRTPAYDVIRCIDGPLTSHRSGCSGD